MPASHGDGLRHEFGEGVLGLMTPDGVESEGAVVFSWIDDLTVWQEAELDERLEALQMPSMSPS